MNEPPDRRPNLRPNLAVCLVALVVIVAFCVLVGWGLAYIAALLRQDPGVPTPPPPPEPGVQFQIVTAALQLEGIR